MTNSKSVLVQARFSSKRLPGKALLPILGDTSTLEFLLHRLSVGLDSDIKLALLTSEERDDDALSAIANRMGVAVVRGDLNDVLSRYQKAISVVQCKYVCRVTADNPFTDPHMINDFFRSPPSRGEYKSTKLGNGWPVGIDVEFFSAADLLKLDGSLLSAEEREHVTLSLYSEGPFRLPILTGLHSELAGSQFVNCSLTIDTPQDLVRIRKVAEVLGDFAAYADWTRVAEVAASILDEA